MSLSCMNMMNYLYDKLLIYFFRSVLKGMMSPMLYISKYRLLHCFIYVPKIKVSPVTDRTKVRVEIVQTMHRLRKKKYTHFTDEKKSKALSKLFLGQ